GERWNHRRGRVRTYRLPIRHRRSGAILYVLQYAGFTLGAGLLLAALHLRRRYDLVQVNTVPDTLVFSALVPRLLGARVLLDLHECMPELFATKFKVELNHPAVRLVARLEQASIRFSNFAITCNDCTRALFV